MYWKIVRFVKKKLQFSRIMVDSTPVEKKIQVDCHSKNTLKHLFAL